MKKVIFLILVALFISFDKEEVDFSGQTRTDINIYLADEELTEYFSTDKNIETIPLESTPWLKIAEI